MHRSGTSWLGSLLCAGGDFINIGEPLNVMNRQTIFPACVKRWYTHITGGNEENYLSYYRDAIAFKSHPTLDIKRMRIGSPRDPFRIVTRWGSFLLGRLDDRRLLVKDPFAIFSIDWFLQRLKCHVVVIVRHPVAVVSSLKRLDFRFDFNNLLQQPSLINGPLRSFRAELQAALEAPDDLVGHGSLLWRIIYNTTFADTASRDILVVRHEDLSLDPVHHCKMLYRSLGLTLSGRALKTIMGSTSEGNPIEVSRRSPFTTKLDSRANLANWRHRLEPDEVDRIVEITEPVVSRYYPEGLRILGSRLSDPSSFTARSVERS